MQTPRQIHEQKQGHTHTHTHSHTHTHTHTHTLTHTHTHTHTHTQHNTTQHSHRRNQPNNDQPKQYSPVLNSTMAFRQEYSAVSTCNTLSFSTCSWKIRMWSMKATTRSAAMGDAWRPAAASSGATWRGMEHCAAFSTNSSLQPRRSRATWSVTCT